jgi:hypothetical protein
MLAVSVSKTWKILPALVACLFVMAVVVCLVHTDAVDEVQAPHQGHHHTSSSSTAHSTLDLHCLVAILPAAIVLLYLYLGALYLRVLLSYPAVPSFPPFIPPKASARA